MTSFVFSFLNVTVDKDVMNVTDFYGLKDLFNRIRATLSRFSDGSGLSNAVVKQRSLVRA